MFPLDRHSKCIGNLPILEAVFKYLLKMYPPILKSVNQGSPSPSPHMPDTGFGGKNKTSPTCKQRLLFCGSATPFSNKIGGQTCLCPRSYMAVQQDAGHRHDCSERPCHQFCLKNGMALAWNGNATHDGEGVLGKQRSRV